MSKGTVKGKPGATHGTVAVIINDDTNYADVPKGFTLDFGPAYPPNPKDVYRELNDGDYVEFDITGYGTDPEGGQQTGSCNVTRIFTGKGIGSVETVNSINSGTLTVTLANSVTRVQQAASLGYYNQTGHTDETKVTLRQNDYVEIENVDVKNMKCDVVRRIESIGLIKTITGTTGTMTVKQAPNAALIDTDLTFSVYIPAPAVFNVGDTVEIDIIDASNCVYVQLLDAATT